MKQGNQMFLEFQIVDENNNLLNINAISKIQFIIGNVIKTYDDVHTDVKYDYDKQLFKIWLKEEETFNFKDEVKMEARILFKGDTNKTVIGTKIESRKWQSTLREIPLDV